MPVRILPVKPKLQQPKKKHKKPVIKGPAKRLPEKNKRTWNLMDTAEEARISELAGIIKKQGTTHGKIRALKLMLNDSNPNLRTAALNWFHDLHALGELAYLERMQGREKNPSVKTKFGGVIGELHRLKSRKK